MSPRCAPILFVIERSGLNSLVLALAFAIALSVACWLVRMPVKASASSVC